MIPTDPNTVSQQAMRDAMVYASDRWVNFTDTDRANWAAYAARKTLPNRLGEEQHVTGRNLHARLCTFRRYVINTLGLLCTLDDYAPTNSQDTWPAVPLVSLDSYPSPTAINIQWDFDMGWLEYDAAFLAVFVSTPRPRTVNWFRGPWQLIGAIQGNDDPVPEPPFTIALPLDRRPAVDQRIFVKLRLSRPGSDLGSPMCYTLTNG